MDPVTLNSKSVHCTSGGVIHEHELLSIELVCCHVVDLWRPFQNATWHIPTELPRALRLLTSAVNLSFLSRLLSPLPYDVDPVAGGQDPIEMGSQAAAGAAVTPHLWIAKATAQAARVHRPHDIRRRLGCVEPLCRGVLDAR